VLLHYLVKTKMQKRHIKTLAEIDIHYAST